MLTAYLLCVDGVPAEVVTPVATAEDVYIFRVSPSPSAQSACRGAFADTAPLCCPAAPGAMQKLPSLAVRDVSAAANTDVI